MTGEDPKPMVACPFCGKTIASENQWGRLSIDVEDAEAVAEHFFKAISNDARKPLEAEIIRLKALLFDLQNAGSDGANVE